MLTIEKGPFAGTVIPTEQLVPARDDASQIRLKPDGTPLTYWPAQNRTPLFLELFSPLNGWVLTVSNAPGAFTLPDRYLGSDGSIVQQPTVMFTARLSKDGVVVAEATALATIWGSRAWETGETIARGRLYDALGLCVPWGWDQPTPIDAPKKVPSTSVIPLVQPMAHKAPAPVEQVADVAASASDAPRIVEAASEATPIVVAETAITDVSASNAVRIDANLLRTIEIQAAAQGIPVPTFEGIRDAKDFMRKLLTKPQPQQQQGEA